MKHSELISFKKSLELYDLRQSGDIVETQLKSLVQTINNQYNIKGSKTDKDVLENQYQIIKNGFAALKYVVDKIASDVDSIIEDKKHELITLSEQYYQSELKKSPTEILDLHSSQQFLMTDRFFSSISKYGSWKHATMIIHPGRESFVETMIDNDPLYIVDRNYELLEPTLAKFNPVYQRRIRKYVVDESIEGDILGQLPDGQFGLCVVYHYFNFIPFELVQRYIKEIYKKLKPGGVLIFTFNDCENERAVKLTEESERCYANGTVLAVESEKMGYEILYTEEHYPGFGTWIEIKKRGELTSIRGSQTLAKILPK